MRDRECPGCGKETLVEHGLCNWVCLNDDCRMVYSDEELDCGVEDFE